MGVRAFHPVGSKGLAPVAIVWLRVQVKHTVLFVCQTDFWSLVSILKINLSRNKLLDSLVQPKHLSPFRLSRPKRTPEHAQFRPEMPYM